MAMRQKKRHFHSLAETSAKLMDPILRKRAGLNIELMENWQALVGGELAKNSLPLKILWQKRANQDDAFSPATLLIACDGFAAMKISHETNEIIQRINAFFGYTAINRIKVEQKPIIEKVIFKKTQAKPSQEDEDYIIESTKNVEDEKLRQSLRALGSAIFAEKNG